MLLEFLDLKILYAAIVLLVVTWFVRKRKSELDYLPHVKGGWPVAGNALQLNQCGRTDQTLEKWAEQYGPIFTVKVFNMTWVVVSGYNEIHEVLVQKSKAFAGRHRFFRFSYLVFGNKDIIMSDPTLPNFQPMRKALHRTIQPRGNNLNRIETVLIDMAQQLVDKIKSHNGKPFDIKDDLYNFACKVAVTMICGQHVNDKDDILADMILVDQLSVENISPISGVELDLFPWLRYFGHPVWKKLHQLTKLRQKLFEKFWHIGTDSYSTNDKPTCIVHAMAQMVDKKSKFYEPSLTTEHAEAMMLDTIGASVLTTSTSAYALINLLIHYPHIYKKIQAEIDAKVGHDRSPNIYDRESMHYTVATILELLRFTSIAPALIPHVALEDTTIGAHKIPAGTITVNLVCHLHRDEKFWGDPLVFRPDRFLDEAGNLLSADHQNRKHLMPFGAGIRECVGAVFAQRRLFILIASIVQAFDLEPGDVRVSCDRADYTDGALITQKSYSVRLLERNV